MCGSIIFLGDTMQKGRKQQLKSGDEYDVICDRYRYKYLTNRPKNISDVKRRLNKRSRQEARATILEELDFETNC